MTVREPHSNSSYGLKSALSVCYYETIS